MVEGGAEKPRFLPNFPHERPARVSLPFTGEKTLLRAARKFVGATLDSTSKHSQQATAAVTYTAEDHLANLGLLFSGRAIHQHPRITELPTASGSEAETSDAIGSELQDCSDTSHLSFTMRSSSLSQAHPSSPIMAGAGRSKSGYAPTQSTDPLADIQARQKDIQARLAALKAKRREQTQPTAADKAHSDAIIHAAQVAETKRIQDGSAAAELKRHEQEIMGKELEGDERESKERAKEDRLEEECKEVHRNTGEANAAVEVNVVAHARAAPNSKSAGGKEETSLLKFNLDTLNPTSIEEEEEKAKKRLQHQADTKIKEQSLKRTEAELSRLEGEEESRRKENDVAAASAIAELSAAGARVKAAMKDKLEVESLIDQAEKEIVAANERCQGLKRKETITIAELVEAEKVASALNTKIGQMDALDQKARITYNDKRDEIVKKIQIEKANLAATGKGEAKPKAVNAPQKPVSFKSSAIKIVGPTAATNDESRKTVKTLGETSFSAWPLPTGTREPKRHRRVKLIGLPATATLANIIALVYHGEIQEVRFTPGSSFAEVLFLKSSDCERYFAATPNGIPFLGDTTQYITVEKMEPEPTNDTVKGYIERQVTRCVRALDVDGDWGRLALQRLAAGKNGRQVERIVNGQNAQGRRVVDFRFAKIQDAVAFKGELDRDAEWETASLKFGPDPCAKHTAVHTGLM